jgi:hypothetical protein
MSEWIHVRTVDKVPQVRENLNSAFEEHNTDPNLSAGFGSSEPSMFLSVVRPAEPSVNDIIEQANKVTTQDTTGKNVEGEYVDPNWVVNWAVTPQDLEVSKQLKIADMQQALDAHYASGYPVGGGLVFPLTEDFYRHMQARYSFLLEFDDNGVPLNTTVAFTDVNGEEVLANKAQLRTHLLAYVKDYYLGPEKESVNKKAAINNAADVAAVDAVTWTF